MESQLIQKFKACINSIEFDDRQLYMTTEYVLEKINDKFGEVYTDEFIQDLAAIIKRYFFKVDGLTVSDLEWNMDNDIKNAENFNKLSSQTTTSMKSTIESKTVLI